jgi:hypothetical protein
MCLLHLLEKKFASMLLLALKRNVPCIWPVAVTAVVLSIIWRGWQLALFCTFFHSCQSVAGPCIK